MVNPVTWGANGWYFVHCLELNFRQTHVAQYRELLRVLAQILPCDTCKINYSAHLATYPVEAIVDAASFRVWAVNVHNAVNASLGKPLHSGGYPGLPPTGQKISHARVIAFFTAIVRGAMEHKNKTTFAAVGRFRRLLGLVFPCQLCRTRLARARPGNMQGVIRILKK